MLRSAAPLLAGVLGLVTCVEASNSSKETTHAVAQAAPADAPPRPSTPPPPKPDTAWPNEPSGMTRTVDWSFATLAGSGWSYAPQASFVRLVADSADPTVAEFVYPVGFTGGGEAPGIITAPGFGAQGAREVYWAFTFKANAEWQNHSSYVNKIGYGGIGGTTFGLTWHWSTEWRGGVKEPNISLFEGDRYWDFNTAQATPVRAGRWYKVEALFRPSSGDGIRDGIVRVWIDGVLCANHVNVATTSGRITEVRFEPTWGGVGSTPKNREDYFRFGRARISVR